MGRPHEEATGGERLLLEAVVAGGELGVVQLGVETARGEQLLVAALLHDVAVAHDQDEIGRTDGGEPMRDDEGVRPAMSRSMASWMRSSVRVSTEEVASSRMSMRRSARRPGQW